MDKKIKMVLYGEPGVGKSTFASKAPNPLFICSDGNFAWLDLDESHCREVNSWQECKKILNDKELLDNYETIVLDLTEDLFKWCEQEFCIKNKLEHIGDLGYAKGYTITRNEFFIEIAKLIALDKHIILIMHGQTFVEKDRRGIEHTKYSPTSRMPDKLVDMIEGRVRYFLRCYVKDEEIDEGHFVKKRYLSLVPKANEFGISRGIDESKTKEDILLDWNEFINAVGLDIKETKKESKKKEKVKESITLDKEVTVEVDKETEDDKELEIKEEPKKEKVKEEIKEEVKEEPKEEVKEDKKELSNEEKIAAIKAKLAKLKK